MSRFIESIQLKDGVLVNWQLHQQRMQRTIRSHFGQLGQIDLAGIQREAKHYPVGMYKCRIIYAQRLEEISFQPYQIRPINSLKVVTSELDYSLKYEDRKELNQLFAQRGDCDDVIIIKNGLVTDGSYTNLAFFDGHKWWTPTAPLLKGIQREALLTAKIIQEKEILATDLPTYQKVKLFNAMMDWQYAPEVSIDQIKMTF